MKPITIIIPSFNTEKYLKECTDSLMTYTPIELFDLVIVDQGSKDGSIDVIKKLQCYEILNDKNTGYAGGCNQGMRFAKTPNVCVLNSDTILTPHWLEPLLESAKAHIGIVSPVIRNAKTRVPGERRDADGCVKFYPGVCWIIQKIVLEKIGYFDEQFGSGLDEDRDFCERILDNYYQIFVDKRSFIYHHEHQTFYANNIIMDQNHKENITKLLAKPCRRRKEQQENLRKLAEEQNAKN